MMHDSYRQKNMRTCKEALKYSEGLQNMLALYLWLSFRNMKAFYDVEEAHAPKARGKGALEWCLRQVSFCAHGYGRRVLEGEGG